MAPTICTDKDERCRHTIRETRKSNNNNNNSSAFSVINYVGKISHQRQNTNKSKLQKKITSTLINNNNLQKTIKKQFKLNNNNINLNINNNGHSENDSGSDMEILSDESASNNSSNATSNNNSDDECSPFMNLRYRLMSDEEDDDNYNDNLHKNISIVNIKSTTTIKNNNYQHQQQLQHKKLPHNSKGLLEIAVKTVQLIHRNQILQEKLAQLQAETHDFITSVMLNPENQALRDEIEKKKQKSDET